MSNRKRERLMTKEEMQKAMDFIVRQITEGRNGKP
jgi:hypothetical protein